MSSSTSSFKPFLKAFLYTLAIGCVLIETFILLVDPLDIFPFSLPIKREPITNNQRFVYPVLARKKYGDSVVIGTSAARSFDPEILNTTFGGVFLNLAMNGGRPYEQYRLAEIFFRTHPDARMIILGIDIRSDDFWCQQAPSRKYTDYGYAEWFFSNNWYEGIEYMFNGKNLEYAVNLVQYAMGRIPPKYRKDGYAPILKLEDYSLVKTREQVYGQTQPKEKPTPFPQPVLGKKQVASLSFPELYYLPLLLDTIPNHTEKYVYFFPQHWYHQPVVNSAADSELKECKERIKNILFRYPRVHFKDMMVKSDFTTEDSNYYDSFHIAPKGDVAEKVITMLRDMK